MTEITFSWAIAQRFFRAIKYAVIYIFYFIIKLNRVRKQSYAAMCIYAPSPIVFKSA